MKATTEYPTTKGMTDAAVHARQLASRRVTVTTRRVPTAVRFATPKAMVTDPDYVR
jgi:hypothetical protein